MSRRRVPAADRPAADHPDRRGGQAVDHADIALRVGGEPLRVSVTVPRAPASRRALLPLFRQVADAVVDASVRRAERAGERVACARGCGACCRQLVPITEPEAFALRDLVASLPAARRETVRARFSAARERLAAAGLLDGLRGAHQPEPGELHARGLDYFALGIPCPFLDDEACSIHGQRPIACREYLVSSPPGNCAAPSAGGVRMVPIAGHVSSALGRSVPAGAAAPGRPAWVPLVLALEWADNATEESPRPAREIVEQFFRQLAR